MANKQGNKMDTAMKRHLDFAPDRRRLRAEMIAHHIALALNPWIERMERLEEWVESQRDDADKRGLPRTMRDIYEKIFETLYIEGAEVITDVDRAAAGLPYRNAKGLTEIELRIMEDRLTSVMLSAMPPIMAKAE
jgi:hypothetical protein